MLLSLFPSKTWVEKGHILEPILTLFNNDLGLYRTNAFSNVSTFVLSKTKQRIFIYTSVCVLLFLRFHTFWCVIFQTWTHKYADESIVWRIFRQNFLKPKFLLVLPQEERIENRCIINVTLLVFLKISIFIFLWFSWFSLFSVVRVHSKDFDWSVKFTLAGHARSEIKWCQSC